MDLIQEREGFLEMHAQATLRVDPSAGGLQLHESGQAAPYIVDNKSHATGPIYTLTLPSPSLRAELQPMPFQQGYVLFLEGGALRLILDLADNGDALLKAVKQNKVGTWKNLDATLTMDLNQGATGVRNLGRDSSMTMNDRNMGAQRYQLEFVGVPHPLQLQQSERDEEIYLLDLWLPALEVSLELAPGAFRPLLKSLRKP